MPKWLGPEGLLLVFFLSAAAGLCSRSDVYSASSARASDTPIYSKSFTITGHPSDVNLGMDRTFLVDLDQSGENDLIIGAPSYDSGPFGNVGALYIIYHALLAKFTSKTIDLSNPANL